MSKKIVLFKQFVALCALAALASCSSSTETTGPGTGTGGGSLIVPSIDFGTLAARQAKDTVVAFFNTTTDTLVIDSSHASSSELTDSNFSSAKRLAPNSYKNFAFHFKSDSLGARTVFDSIRYHRGAQSASVVMSVHANMGGTSGGGSALFAPAVVDFGALQTGVWHDTTILIVNTGTSPIVIQSSSVSSAEVRDTNFLSPVVISGGGYRMIHLQFNPSQQGARVATDMITYANGTSAQTLTITLQAQGTVPAVVTPGPGSTFTFSYVEVDTNGRQSGPYDSLYTVASNSLFFQGKSNVMSVRDRQGSLSYYHVEQNGDISVFVDLSQAGALGMPLPSMWFTIPIASRQTITNTFLDTTMNVDFSGLPVAIHVTASSTAQYVASPTVTAASKSWATDEGSFVVSFNASGLGGLFTANQTHTTIIYYSKQLGFYVKRTDSDSASQTGQPKATTTSDSYTLKSYNVK